MGYEKCIVSFIDVLGFKSHLKNKTPEEITSMLSALRQATAPDAPVVPEARMKYHRMASEVVIENISDAVVRMRTIETQYQDGAFFLELMDLLHAQISCISQGVLIRAGVTIGDVHIGHDGEGPVFGPGLLRAYEMESEEVIYPRIAIEEVAVERFRNDDSLWREGHSFDDEQEFVGKILAQDEAGLSFIDYLRASETEFDDFTGYLYFLREHKTLIDEGLEAKNPAKVKRKFQWLRAYHDCIIGELMLRFENNAEAAADFREEFDCDSRDYLSELLII